MKKNNIALFFKVIIIFITFSQAVFSQTAKFKKANKLYEDLAYTEAATIYLDITKTDFKSTELYEKLGDCYYFNANYKSAAKWYGKLFEKTKDVSSIYYLRYAQSLNSGGIKDLAAEYFDIFVEQVNGEKLFNAESYLNLIEDSEQYNLRLLKINTQGIDFGGAFYKNKLVFASTHSKVTRSKLKSEWDGYPYLNLFEATIKDDGSLSSPELFNKKINTKFHESSPTFSKDGKTMYFTRSNTLKESEKALNKIVHTKIYRAILVNNEWTKIEDLSINDNNYSNAHPVLNATNDLMYFVSDRPESYGETDIYVVAIDADGTLGNPINLGLGINTPGRESFPFITPSSELYFSSDGHFGLGGLDVFYVQLNKNGTFENFRNIGRPINSSYDDYAFIINEGKGYLSSNRTNGYGKDDIYSIEEIIIKCEQTVSGVVRESVYNALLPDAVVTLYDMEGVKIESVIADRNGLYSFNLDCEKSYKVTATKDNYKDETVEFVTSNISNENLDIPLTLTIVEFITVRGIKMINIDPIYFDLDKDDIRDDAARELEKVYKILVKYPEIKIRLESHTDSRAPDAYNLDLSKRRAKSTLEWILNKGIDESRITGRGYGETELVNKCSNGVKCSDIEHQKNRRTEFIIANPEVIR